LSDSKDPISKRLICGVTSARHFLGDFWAAGLAAGFLLPSGAAAVAAGDGDGDGDGEVIVTGAEATDGEGCGGAAGRVSDCNAECEPLIPGSDNNNASNMKATAAPIVIRARMFCVPRGPKAVLETLLVNKAPASALPGCRSTTTMSTAQAAINNP
jgi:hypothetical protein